MRATMIPIACLVLFMAVPLSAEKGDKAKYVGGTLTGITENTDFEFDTSGEAVAVALWKKHKGNPAGKLEIPYKAIESIEYGQKAGRRVGVAIAVSPLALFSKKRKHYVTVAYIDQTGKKQGIVMELGKGDVRRTLTTMETRSGQHIEFESEEAKKNLP